VAGPLGSRHPLITPFQAFKTSDSHVIIACGNNNLFNRLCNIIGLEQLIDDPRFTTNALRTENVGQLAELIQTKTLEKTTSEWLEILLKADLPSAPINTIDKLFLDPQLAARNMLVEVEQAGIGKVKVAGNPIKLSSVPPEDELPDLPAPQIGEHTKEILMEMLGYSEADAERYFEENHLH